MPERAAKRDFVKLDLDKPANQAECTRACFIFISSLGRTSKGFFEDGYEHEFDTEPAAFARAAQLREQMGAERVVRIQEYGMWNDEWASLPMRKVWIDVRTLHK